MYATNFFEDYMLNLLRGQNIPAQANMYLALFLSNPSDTGTAGTEISYSGYARQKITFTTPTPSGSGMMMQNSATISFPESPVAISSPVSYVGVYDSSSIGTGNMWLYGQLDTPLTVQAGVSPVFREGNVKWIWSGNLTTYYRTAIMNTLRNTACSGFTPYIAFCNGDPTTTGSEFSGNNYARVPVTMTVPAQQSSGTDLTQNESEVISSISTGSWGTLTHVALCDNSTGGNYFAVQSTTSYTTPSGTAIGYHAGTLQFNVN